MHEWTSRSPVFPYSGPKYARSRLEPPRFHVKPHVFELEGLAHPLGHRVRERIAQVLGQAAQVLAQGDGAQERLRLRGPDVLALEPAADLLEPCRPQALLRLVRQREVPAPLEVTE